MSGYFANWLRVKLRGEDRHAPTFEVFRGLNGWTWRERASNGQVSGGGGQGTHHYSTKWSAKRAAYAHAARVDGSKVRVLG